MSFLIRKSGLNKGNGPKGKDRMSEESEASPPEPHRRSNSRSSSRRSGSTGGIPVELQTIVEAEPSMSYLRLSAEMVGKKRGSIVRQILLALLLLATHYLIIVEWPSRFGREKEAPIRGNKGIRPVGEKCHQDALGRVHLINNRHAIVFDAGSTGSRVHVYEFQYCGPVLRLLVDELFEEVKPGLSHFHQNPPQAARSLGPLISSALERVPSLTRHCTPLSVKATAGLRLLPEGAVRSILQNVRDFMRKHPFSVGNIEQAVTVMDGAEEGVFAWATVNFLQHKLSLTNMTEGKRKQSPFLAEETSVIMDLGGGSTQIVFAVPSHHGLDFDPLHYPKYYYRLKLHGEEVDLYQQSYLGYGLMEARKQIKNNHLKTMASDGRALRFPCFPREYSESIDMGAGKRLELMGDGVNWDACLATVTPIFRKGETCTLHPCSFNGIHQPPLRSRTLTAFSYFYDRLIPLGLGSPVSLYEIDREGRRMCRPTPGTHYEKFLKENPQWCLDLAYIYSLLRVGYNIAFDQPITVTKQINGYEAGWSLGAALKLLESAPDCDSAFLK